ncbi:MULTISPECIES: peptidoglycan-N-acetylglucosamine deacetylase [Bacillus cereus group]|uniref:Polysaccharide deacetylase n=1 Tax=Bacillus cereus TaxID=1396 RepID=A0AA44QB06_BACCE|nr:MULTISPECIES: polysaccharide deacetylase family protein [Bacillus cereus group]PFA17674.1 polysaccharide deacetylase [Bacillus cereus]PFN00452.1 polysaccharide deacetylase [Bacillus cereus]PFO78878.1 polysaccharide deacetylase [Bacillus cereus]PFR19575.1 polysaccharide deacetylase [Bacillus cereus]PFS02132.1 polysaccharide deacetylase [Bacillus cereus]
MHNRIRMTTLVKRALLICVGVLFLYEAVYGSTHIALASTEDEAKSVQLVSEIQTALAPKEAPKQYNGQVRKVAYLTFDDGPGKYTAELLDMLKAENAKATFFLIGANVKAFPDLVKREDAEGHYVGMHSMTHNYKKLYTEGRYVDEMKEDQGLIAGVIGKSPTLTRPSYGSMPGLNEALRNKVVENNLKVWDWTIDSLDWKYNKMPVDAASAQIVQNVLAGATNPTEVILMHDIHPQSVKAVPAIIKGLKERGYELESYQEDGHFPLNFWHDNRM